MALLTGVFIRVLLLIVFVNHFDGRGSCFEVDSGVCYSVEIVEDDSDESGLDQGLVDTQVVESSSFNAIEKLLMDELEYDEVYNNSEQAIDNKYKFDEVGLVVCYEKEDIVVEAKDDSCSVEVENDESVDIVQKVYWGLSGKELLGRLLELGKIELMVSVNSKLYYLDSLPMRGESIECSEGHFIPVTNIGVALGKEDGVEVERIADEFSVDSSEVMVRALISSQVGKEFAELQNAHGGVEELYIGFEGDDYKLIVVK